MRRFLITSPAFTGEADILYDESGRLVKIDLMNTDMDASLVQSFKAKVPALVDSLADAFATSNATIIEADAEVEFKSFWTAYNKKINKARCIPLWNKLSIADQVKAVQGVKLYEKFLRSLPYERAKADPEKYLKDRYWGNEWK